jgi:DNA polymerase-1
MPRETAFYLEHVNVVSTTSEARAMTELAEQRPLGWIGFDTEFKFDWAPLWIDKRTTIHDLHSTHPLLLSLAMVEPDPAGDARVYRFVVDLRRPEVLPSLKTVLGLPCCFVAHFARAEFCCLWKLGLPEPRWLWDTLVCEQALSLGRTHKRYRRRATDDDLDEVRAGEAARSEEESYLSLVATCRRRGVDYPYEGAKDRLQRSFRDHPDAAPFSPEQLDYSVADAVAVAKLYPRQLAKATLEGVLDHLKAVEMPWVVTNARMTWRGVRVDSEKCARVLLACDRHLAVLRPRLAELGVANVRSHPQLKAYFAQHGLLELFRRGHRYSFDKEQLSQYGERHGAIALIHSTRRVLDLQGERILGGELVGSDGRVHPDHRQLGAHTGRQTSRWPNVLGLGKVFRPLIIPEPGRGIGEVDLSQIEVGIAAAVYGDRNLIEMFNTGDVYSAMAQRFYGGRLAEEDRRLDSVEFKRKHRDLRDRMKICTLGIIYGLTAHGLGKHLGVSEGEAARLLVTFMGMFPDLKRALTRAAEIGAIRGYATTATGLRRHRRNLGTGVSRWEQNWLINHPVQGTAAALFKVAGNRLDRLYQPHDAWLILALHDAFIFESPLASIQEVAELTSRVMREAIQEAYPLLRPGVEVNIERPHCWNKDGHDDSIDRWIEDP